MSAVLLNCRIAACVHAAPQGAVAACAAPLVGTLAERLFGFSGSGTGKRCFAVSVLQIEVSSACPRGVVVCDASACRLSEAACCLAPRRRCCAVTRDRQTDLANAAALSNALLCFLVVPWTITLALYTGVWLVQRMLLYSGAVQFVSLVGASRTCSTGTLRHAVQPPADMDMRCTYSLQGCIVHTPRTAQLRWQPSSPC